MTATLASGPIIAMDLGAVLEDVRGRRLSEFLRRTTADYKSNEVRYCEHPGRDVDLRTHEVSKTYAGCFTEESAKFRGIDASFLGIFWHSSRLHSVDELQDLHIVYLISQASQGTAVNSERTLRTRRSRSCSKTFWAVSDR